MSHQKSNFVHFIEDWNPEIGTLIHKMESIIYQDPASAIVKARVFVEKIIEGIFYFEKVNVQENWSLHDKIAYLSKDYLDREIESLLHTVRLAGNKAAHTLNYDDLSEAIKLHRAIYMIFRWYYETYLSSQATLPDYVYPKPPAENSEEIQNLKAEVMRIMELVRTEQTGSSPTKLIDAQDSKKVDEVSPDSNNKSLLELDLPTGQSYLLREMRRLKESSKEAIENANEFSRFKDYLHVERKVQHDIEHILGYRKTTNNANLVLLCGSVGDGKSHLLAYLKENKPELLAEYEIFNDATESFSPNKDAMETLDDILKEFSDERIENTTKKVILAINLGILHNFISVKSRDGVSYRRLQSFVSKSGLFTEQLTQEQMWDDYFDLISFSEYHPYELTTSGVESRFFGELMKRVFSADENNPFFLAYKEDLSRDVKTMMHENYLLLQDGIIQNQVIQFITQAIIKFKIVISARAFLNFIADIIIPDELIPFDFLNDFERMENAVPTLMFKRRERSFILRAMFELDPIHNRHMETDELVITLNTSDNWKDIVETYIKSEVALRWIKVFQQSDENGYSRGIFSSYYEFIIRLAQLTNVDFFTRTSSNIYNKYIRLLFGFNVGAKNELRMIYDEVKEAVFRWRGSPSKDYVYIGKSTETIRIAQKLILKPYTQNIKQFSTDTLVNFRNTILVTYSFNDTLVNIDIDYPLFELLQKIINGYCPNKKDEEDAIKFVEFIERIMHFGDKNRELLIHFIEDSKQYKLYKDNFSSFVFEKE